jgi:hypothetical protein
MRALLRIADNSTGVQAMTEKENSKANSSDEQGDTVKKTVDQEQKQRQSRRQSLRTILAGSGVIAGAGASIPKWQKPVVDSILLPAHAQTTDSSSGPSTPPSTAPSTPPSTPPSTIPPPSTT